MREYIILVAAASVMMALTEILSPEKWRGYIRIITGFLILAVLLSPIKKLKNADIFVPTEKFEASEITVLDAVSGELVKSVEKDIEERIMTEFGGKATASCLIDLDEEHRIKGVKKITISTKQVPDGLSQRLKEVYGCEDIEFRTE